MAKVGAQRAAELTGKSKSTIQRAMKAGKLSYEVNKNNQREIDVSELERVFGLVPQTNSVSTQTTVTGDAPVTASADLEIQKARHTLELERLNLQIRLLNEQLDGAREQITDLKAQRDQWQKQAQQVLLTSQQSQKQAEERIMELREREAQRQRMIQQRNRQQAAGGSNTQNPAKSGGQPQFRTVKANNENQKNGRFRLSDFFKGKKAQTA